MLLEFFHPLPRGLSRAELAARRITERIAALERELRTPIELPLSAPTPPRKPPQALRTPNVCSACGGPCVVELLSAKWQLQCVRCGGAKAS